jgi:hypothetical protein
VAASDFVGQGYGERRRRERLIASARKNAQALFTPERLKKVARGWWHQPLETFPIKLDILRERESFNVLRRKNGVRVA